MLFELWIKHHATIALLVDPARVDRAHDVGADPRQQRPASSPGGGVRARRGEHETIAYAAGMLELDKFVGESRDKQAAVEFLKDEEQGYDQDGR